MRWTVRGERTLTISSEGIDAFPGVHAPIADDPDGFARSQDRVVADDSLGRDLSKNGHRLHLENPHLEIDGTADSGLDGTFGRCPSPASSPSFETDPARVIELLVGLPDVTVLGEVRHADDSVEPHSRGTLWTVNEVATVPGCDRHTVNEAVLAATRHESGVTAQANGRPVELAESDRRWAADSDDIHGPVSENAWV